MLVMWPVWKNLSPTISFASLGVNPKEHLVLFAMQPIWWDTFFPIIYDYQFRIPFFQSTLGRNLFAFKGAATSVGINDFAKISLALLEIVHHLNEFCTANIVPNKTYDAYWKDVSGEAEFKESKTEWLEHAFKGIGSSFNSTQNTKVSRVCLLAFWEVICVYFSFLSSASPILK